MSWRFLFVFALLLPALAVLPAYGELESGGSAEVESDAEAADLHGDGDHDDDGHGDDGHGDDGHGDDGHGDDGHGDDGHGDDGHGDDGHADSHGAAHGGSHGGGEKGSVDPLTFDPDLAIWTLIIFLAMLAILSQVAWKPIMEGLAAREENIGGAIAAAEQKHKEAEELLAKHQAELAGAADQVRALLEEARRDADATIAQAKSDAKSEFEAERLRAARDIEQARSAAVRSLAEQTAGLAIDLAGKVVQKDISADRQQEIVHEALGRFTSSDPSAN